MLKDRKYDLEGRLVDYTDIINDVTKQLSNNYFSKHLIKQIIRSGTSPALNYAEAQSAESRRNFMHKMTISLKELRETLLNLKIVEKNNLCSDDQVLKNGLKETDELIPIFVKSIETAKKNGR